MKEHVLEGKSLEWLLESATDAMIITDREGRIILANPPVERLFGYPLQELIGKPMEILLPERFRRAHGSQRTGYFTQPSARAMGTGMELLGQRQDGSEFPVDVSLSPLKTEQGMLVMATIHDITRRKQAEEALRESDARMRAIFDTAVDGIVTIDEHGIIERFNPAAERMFGYSEAEVAGNNVSMLMPSPYREAHDGYLAHYLQTGEKKIIGIGREVVGTAQRRHILPHGSGGRRNAPERATHVRRNRARHQRAQAAEEQRTLLVQELESANEELKNFAYVVSHDLKAPLRAIGSLADWLSTDYADKFDAEGKEHMRLLVSRVRRMDSLIDGILLYSRVGRVKETALPVDLDSLAREVIDLLAPPPNIAVTIETPLPTVVTEPTRIQQVFQNLLSNAIKYMDKPEGKIRLGCVAEGKEWKFSVADNGPGIEERHFERIFQLFQTLTPRDKVESTGVGLSLVKKIVEMYGGRIWVESRMGEGSTFFFTLPRTKTSIRSTQRKNSIMRFANQPILLVEDDEVDAMTVKRALKDLHVTNPLVLRENGEEALAYLRDPNNEKPCLILLDLNMPVMSGIEFLQVDKHDDALKAIPVVVLTTSQEQQDKVSSFNLGVAGYMAKPVAYQQFVEVMRTINAYWTISEIPQ